MCLLSQAEMKMRRNKHNKRIMKDYEIEPMQVLPELVINLNTGKISASKDNNVVKIKSFRKSEKASRS